jgi:hypothetical protein
MLWIYFRKKGLNEIFFERLVAKRNVRNFNACYSSFPRLCEHLLKLNNDYLDWNEESIAIASENKAKTQSQEDLGRIIASDSMTSQVSRADPRRLIIYRGGQGISFKFIAILLMMNPWISCLL